MALDSLSSVAEESSSGSRREGVGEDGLHLPASNARYVILGKGQVTSINQNIGLRLYIYLYEGRALPEYVYIFV